MTKDWDQYKTEIEKLYITNGKSLDDVRRILKGKHGFDASRGYRMKLEHWGMKKNKVPLSHRAQNRPRPKARTGNIDSASSGAHSSNNVSDLLESNNMPSSSHPESNATLWQGFNFPALNDTSLPTPSLHDSSNVPYMSLDREVGWSSEPDIFKTINEGLATDLLEQLSSGASVDIRDNFNDSPLHVAIRKGNIGMTDALLRYGADVDASGHRGRTPLHLSVASKNMLQLLLKYHPKISLQDDEGDSALHYFIRQYSWWEHTEHQVAIRSVLFAGANINIRNKAGDSPLHRIIDRDIPESVTYMEMVLEFLNCKPDVTTAMRNGQALLEVFLENTNILQKDRFRWNIPEWLSVGFRCLEQFLVVGANPNVTFHSQPFLHCCLESSSIVRKVTASRSFVLHLLEKADLDIPASNGDYPLHSVLNRSSSYWRSDSRFQYCQVTSTLIARQVDVNKPNRAGKTPLEVWLTSSRPQATLMKVTALLIEAGASSTITTTVGESLFDFLPRQPRECRIFLTRTLLKADIKAQQPGTNAAAASEWVEVWRSARQASLWGIAKTSLTKLDALDFRPKSKDFMECAFQIVAERLLERHRLQLNLFLRKKLDRESAAEDREEYCAILRDCRERKADIDVSFYHFLLDIMDI